MRAAILGLLLPLASFGAANMVGSGLINSNGQFVITMSPCSSPLTPASGVTGLTMFTQSFATYSIASATTSGCVLTVTVNVAASQTLPVMHDQGQQFWSITAASNLTDNAGNTVSASGNTTVGTTTNNSTWQEVGGTDLASTVRLDGSPKIATSAQGSAQWVSADGCLRFTASASGSGSFLIYTFNYTSGYKIFQDGVQIGSQITTTGDTGFSSYTAASSLSGTHTYEACSNLRGNAIYILYGIQLVNMTYGAQPAAKKLMFVTGASEVDCTGISDTTTCAWWLMARQLGYSDQRLGQSGWPVTVNTFGGIQYTTTNLRDCAKNPGGLCATAWANFNFSSPPDFILLIPGGNDPLVGTLIGPDYTTAGYFEGDSVTYAVNAVATLLPTANTVKIFDEYYLLAAGGTCPGSTAQTTYQASWQGVAAAVLTAHPTWHVSTHSTFAATCAFVATDYQPDHLHLSGSNTPVSGQQKWANIMLPFLNGFVANQSVIMVGQ